MQGIRALRHDNANLREEIVELSDEITQLRKTLSRIQTALRAELEVIRLVQGEEVQ
jgi:predicted  nucleic acid-binding Zn-ribbon protein